MWASPSAPLWAGIRHAGLDAPRSPEASAISALFIFGLTEILISYLFYRSVHLPAKLCLRIDVRLAAGNVVLRAHALAGTSEESIIGFISIALEWLLHFFAKDGCTANEQH